MPRHHAPSRSTRAASASRSGRAARRPRLAASGAAADPLALLGASPAAARLLRYFALHPTRAVHARHLQRVLRLGGASVQRELERLVALGALERRAEGRLVCYRPVAPSSVWQAVRLLLADTSDPATIVRDALHDVPGIDAAFVFGSFAKGTAVRESDVDVFIVESPDVDRRLLHRQLAEAGVVMNREVNAIRYTPQALAERLGDPNHAAARFLRDTLAGPKRWVAGAVAAIQPIATAAGLRLTDQLAMIP